MRCRSAPSPCSNRTYAFAALLQLLRDPPREVRQSVSAKVGRGAVWPAAELRVAVRPTG